MAKYGLSQVDLNLRARLALAGMSDKPERDIAALLRSSQPIEKRTRECLAEAFEGGAAGLALKATNKKAGLTTRRFRKHIADLRAGRKAIEAQGQLGYAGGIEKIVGKMGISPKSVEKYVALAHKVDAWVRSTTESDLGQYEHLSKEELEIAYLYAVVTNQKPDDCVRPGLPALVSILNEWDRLHDDARGIFG